MKMTRLFSLAAFVVSAALVAAADKDELPGKKDLFAKEEWYKKQEGKEQATDLSQLARPGRKAPSTSVRVCSRSRSAVEPPFSAVSMSTRTI